jgi:hypothetical protein
MALEDNVKGGVVIAFISKSVISTTLHSLFPCRFSDGHVKTCR